MTIRHRISAQTDTEPDDDWRERAACAGSPTPDDWHPGRGSLTGPNIDAMQTCQRTCTVRDECLAYALARHPLEGIWGATTIEQRAALAGDPHDAATGAPGTAMGYKRGCRCGLCVDYNTRTTRDWKQRTA